MPSIGVRSLLWRDWRLLNGLGRNITVGNTVLNQDFREFIKSLNDNNVRYLVVGGYAVALHGYPRYTKDLDIWIESTAKNAEKAVKALDQFGFGSLGLVADDFLEEDTVIQLGYPPNRVDLLTSLPGVEFRQCFPEKLEIEIEDVTAFFIDVENLKKNKRASKRAQDLADLEKLE